MKSVRFCCSLIVFLAAAFQAFGQGFPLPTQTGSTCDPTIYPGCANHAGATLPGWGQASPITGYSGRWFDSVLQKEFQSGFRTSHGFGIRVSPKRIYWMTTSAVVAYDIPSFFSRLSNRNEQNLVPATSIPIPGTYRATSTPDVILAWDEFFNPEGSGSWSTPLVDGVRRMWDFDWDDRGYVYLATGTFGWGVARDDYSVGSNWMPNGFQDLSFGATAICAMQDGNGNYYAVVGDGSTSQVWSIGTTGSFQHQRQPADLSFGIRSAAKATDGSHRIAIVQSGSGTLNIYNAADVVRGGNPVPVAPVAIPASGWAFASVTTDGTNFFASSNGPSGALISVISPNGSGGYDIKPPTSIGVSGWYNLQYGANMLAATDTVANVWLFTVSPTLALQQLKQLTPLLPTGSPFTFFHDFYALAGSPIYDATPLANNGKSYVLVSTYTLGDVYEVVTSTSSLSLSSSPSSAVYGDPVTFTLTGAGLVKPTVNVQFGDGQGQSGIVATPDYPPIPPHTYSGLDNTHLPHSFAAVATSVPSSPTDAPITASANVTVTAPQQVGFKLLSAPELLFVQPNASAPAMIDAASKIVSGDQFIDASDGSSAGHYVQWTIGGAPTKALPATTPFPDTGVQCGSYLLTYLAHYGPNASALNITNGDAQYGVGGITGPPSTGYSLGYTVKPFAVELKKDSSDSLGLTIAAVARLSNNNADFAAAGGPAGVVSTYHWTLLAADQKRVLQDGGGSATLGNLASNKFIIVPSNVQSGANYYVQLTIEIDPGAVSSACGSTLATDSAKNKLYETILMPYTATTSCAPITTQSLEADYNGSTGDCNSNSGTCSPQDVITFTVAPINGYSFTCAPYSFTWNFGDGSGSMAGDPSNGRATHQFAASSQPYNVTVAVQDAAGHQVTLPIVRQLIVGGSVQPPPNNSCSAISSQNLEADFSGSTGDCSSNYGTCSPQDVIEFHVAAFNGYTFTCSPYSFIWNFGDGSASVAGDPSNGHTTHQFPASAQAYGVTVTVRDSGGHQVTLPLARPLIVGGSVQPPPNNSCPAISSQNLEADYSGSTGDCSSNYGTCSPQDVISFSVAPINGYTLTCTPYSFTWDFGNGVPVAGDPTNGRVTHQFAASSQPYAVTVTVKDSAGHQVTLPLARPLVVGGVPSCTPVTQQNFSVGYNGCTTGGCLDTDTIHFTATPVPPSSCGPYGFTWDFGDGVSVQGDSTDGHVDHKFFGGLYDSITLTVADKSASATVSAPAMKIAATSGVGQLCPLNALCINDNAANPNKYQVALSVPTPSGGTLDVLPVIQNSGFGYFTLPTIDNPKSPQVFVKVIEIPGTPTRRWVFYSGLTNLPYTIKVTDSSRNVTQYFAPSPQGNQSVGDFDVDGAHSTNQAPVLVMSGSVAPTPGSCKSSASALCLLNRFSVTALFKDNPTRSNHQGPGAAVPANNLFGFFRAPAVSPSPTDIQAFVKMVDATSIGQGYWVFLGGLTDFDMTLTVTDTQTGNLKIYEKPAGSTYGWNDNTAFPQH